MNTLTATPLSLAFAGTSFLNPYPGRGCYHESYRRERRRSEEWKQEHERILELTARLREDRGGDSDDEEDTTKAIEEDDLLPSYEEAVRPSMGRRLRRFFCCGV